jgi:hypothetical protein
MNNNKRNVFSVLLNRIINKSNFNKVLIIFSVGFVSRVLVGCFFNVNVFLDYLSYVSIFYYIFMSAFIVLVHEFEHYFNFNIVPLFSFVNEIYTSISKIIGFIVRMLVSMNTRIFSYKLEDIKISSIIKGAKHLFSIDKATMDLNESCTSKSSNKINTIDSKSIKENSYILEKNDGVSKKTLPRRHRYSESILARNEEVRMRRQVAETIAQERLRAGIMRSGEMNFNANTSSQIGSNRIREEERMHQESLRLPSMLNDQDRSILYGNPNITHNNLSPLEPRVNNNYNPLNSQNNSQANNNSNNQGNTNNDSTNNQGNTNNDSSNNQSNTNNYSNINQANNNNNSTHNNQYSTNNSTSYSK